MTSPGADLIADDTLEFMLVFVIVVALLNVCSMPPDGPKKPIPPAAKDRQPPSRADAKKEFASSQCLRIRTRGLRARSRAPVAMQFDEEGDSGCYREPGLSQRPQPGDQRAAHQDPRDEDGRRLLPRLSQFCRQHCSCQRPVPLEKASSVTAAPHIVWLRDTAGTGKWTKRDVLTRDSMLQNPQCRISHPVSGTTDWNLLCQWCAGGKVKAAGNPAAKVVDLSGRDFRFDPIGGHVRGNQRWGNSALLRRLGQSLRCDKSPSPAAVVMQPMGP